jgi:hypothetical protein
MSAIWHVCDPTTIAKAELTVRRLQFGFDSDGRAPPVNPTGAFEIQLSNDNRLKSALHSLILVLPVAILIFGEALRHPDADIELPIIKLKLHVSAILPIFLMILSYVLHRAMRYARIVLWNNVQSPEQMARSLVSPLMTLRPTR